MKKLIAFAGVSVLAGSAFAADVYYWNNKTGDSDIANTNNWTYKINDAGTAIVPATFPPPLDTATSGSTHPKIRFSVGGTLALSNNTELTLQDMFFPTANTDWTIDIGARTLKLFGNCDAALWVGENYPDGQRITLKSGTITTVQATQRDRKIRFGGSATTNKRPSYFRLDGPNATVSDLLVAVNSPNCEFCVTNGAKAYISAAGYSLRLGDVVEVPGSRYVISGAGSLLQMGSNGVQGFFFGDNFRDGSKNLDLVYGEQGGVIVSDGAVVDKTNATIGNRKGSFYAYVDNATWQNAKYIIMGASQDGASTNNVFIARNEASVHVTDTFTVGNYTGYNRAEFYDSTATLGNVYVACNKVGTKTTAPEYYGHNRMVVSNSTLNSSTVFVGGSDVGVGPNMDDNTFEARNATVTLATRLSVGWWGGRNTAVIRDSTFSTGASDLIVGARGDGPGYNALFVSNTTFTTANIHIGGGSSSGANACNNSVTIMDSTLPSTGKTYYMGLYGGGTNHLTIVHSKVTGGIVMGRGGNGYNTALITNCTEYAGNFEVGGNADTTGSGTDGNVVRVVDSAIGTSANPVTQIQIANSYKGGGSNPLVPSRSNRVEMVRSSWYNATTYLGIGGWNGASRGCDGNVMILDDHSHAESTGDNGVRVGGFGFHNRLEVKNGSEFIMGGLCLGYTHGNYAYNGTNVCYVGKDALVENRGYLQSCPGGNVFIVEDGTLTTRYLRFHYYYSAASGKTMDGISTAVAEYGKTAQEIWGTRFVFKGTKPVMRTPYANCTLAKTDYSELGFSASEILEFEFPPEPYANGVLQSAKGVSLVNTNYRFDCSKIAKSDAWKDYKLAEVDDGATLTVSNAEIARIQTALQAAAKEAGFKAKVAKSSDGKKLVASFKSVKGLVIVIR